MIVFVEAEKNNQERTIHIAVEEGKKLGTTEPTEDEVLPKMDKVSAKNSSDLGNGAGQKMEEEVSPKKKRKGAEKGDKSEKPEKPEKGKKMVVESVRISRV